MLHYFSAAVTPTPYQPPGRRIALRARKASLASRLTLLLAAR